jgi:glutaredoxin-related protein
MGDAAVPAVRIFQPRDRDPQSSGVGFDSVDVLQDQEIRQGIKSFSDWPTIPSFM